MIELIVGIIGMTLILVGFLLEEFTKFDHSTIRFNLINVVGAGLLIYYAYTLNSWPFIILNAVWLVAALYKLTRISKF
jgi:hypothetical protein